MSIKDAVYALLSVRLPNGPCGRSHVCLMDQFPEVSHFRFGRPNLTRHRHISLPLASSGWPVTGMQNQSLAGRALPVVRVFLAVAGFDSLRFCAILALGFFPYDAVTDKQ